LSDDEIKDVEELWAIQTTSKSSIKMKLTKNGTSIATKYNR
jgi:hypothetical protein